VKLRQIRRQVRRWASDYPNRRQVRRWASDYPIRRQSLSTRPNHLLQTNLSTRPNHLLQTNLSTWPNLLKLNTALKLPFQHRLP
jgi:hypothetical protein